MRVGTRERSSGSLRMKQNERKKKGRAERWTGWVKEKEQWKKMVAEGRGSKRREG